MSANAESLDPLRGPMPMFGDLARRMWAQLNCSSPEAAPDIYDPIALASDYESIFGPHALDALLRHELADTNYRPTRIHRLLVSLPWADIYTTNYDTLLERAASGIIDRNYSVVPTQEALVGSLRPRIIKLHGSLPDHRPFIITKEHYRQYPRSHAALVNTVQQAVMECSLCMLGFGGNDPNFLAWAGWVHDNLGSAAPPVYLVGVLDIDTRSRTMLERKRIVPIDLGPLFSRKDFPDPPTRHRLANEWFLLNLACGEPDLMKWPFEQRRTASVLPEFPAPRFRLLHDPPSNGDIPVIQRLSNMMKRFPGWLAAPPRSHIGLDLTFSQNSEELTTAIKNPKLARETWSIIAEIQRLRGTPLDADDRESLRAVLEGSHDSSTQWFHLALRYMASLRWAGKWDQHDEWKKRLETRSDLQDQQRAHLAHEVALRALDQLNYGQLREALSTWPALAGAFRLELARAALNVELSEFGAAVRVVRDVLSTVRAGLPAQGASIAALSIEGAAMVFLRTASYEAAKDSTPIPTPYGRMAELARWNCNPDEYFEAAENRLRELPKEHLQIRKDFDIGHVHVMRTGFPGRTPHDAHRQQAFEALHLFEAFGLPFRCGNSTYYSKMAVVAAKAIADAHPERSFAVLLRARDRDALEETCTQLYVARLSRDHVASLFDLAMRVARFRLKNAPTDFKHDDQLAAALELLSRLVRRTSAEKVEAVFELAVDVTRIPNFHNRWLTQATLHCIERAYAMSDKSVRIGRINTLLEIPLVLPNSMSVSTRSWTDPFILLDLPEVPKEERLQWRHHVGSLLADAQHPDPNRRFAAICRLIELYRSRNLDEAESRLFGEALWGQRGADSLPNGFTHVYFPAFLIDLPGVPDPLFAKKLRARLLSSLFPSTDGQRGSARSAAEEVARLGFEWLSHFVSNQNDSLKESEAQAIMVRAVEWLSKHQSRDHHSKSLYESGDSEDALMTAFTGFIGIHVLPVISPDATDSLKPIAALLQALMADSIPTLQWLFELQRLGVVGSEDAARQLLAGIRSPVDSVVSSAVVGVLRWCRQDEEVPKAAFRELLYSVRRPGRRVFSGVVHKFATFLDERSDALDSADVDQLVDATVSLFSETNIFDPNNDSLYDYPEWMLDARAAASHLAAVLWKFYEKHRPVLDQWRIAAEENADPEVRMIWNAVTKLSG